VSGRSSARTSTVTRTGSAIGVDPFGVRRCDIEIIETTVHQQIICEYCGTSSFIPCPFEGYVQFVSGVPAYEALPSLTEDQQFFLDEQICPMCAHEGGE